MDSLNKLRWQCRRGTKELDFLLMGYLDRHYFQADKHLQMQFMELLQMEDDFLITVLLGDTDAGSMNCLIEKIRL